jgi:hypothetical protein
MSQQWVLLRGSSRRRYILIWALLATIGILILHVWSPRTTALIFSAIFAILTHIFSYIGDIINSLQQLVHDISGWFR